MLQVKIIGRVLPDAVKISIQTPELTWKWEEMGLEPRFRIIIRDSVITAECDVERYEATFLTELHKRVSDLARASVNMIAYSTGYGLTVSLDTFVGPGGERSPIVATDPAVPPLCTAFGLGAERRADFEAVFKLVLTEPPLFRALNDLIEAITIPHVSSVNCGRVIESIRRMITPSTSTSVASAWQIMQSTLNISRTYQEWISTQATGPRHADPSFVPGAITSEMTHRTWTIMNRFLEYRKRRNTNLEAPEFPLLT